MNRLTPKQIEFIEAQPVFFVGTAAAEGRVNVSPKGMDTLRVLDERRVLWLNLTGSGNETSAHIKHDGRVTVMFNSYSRNPLILRLYGQGRVVRPGHEDYPELAQHFRTVTGSRQIIVVDVESVQTSCGYSVPLMELKGHRDTLERYWQNKGADAALETQQNRNAESIDGFDTGLND